MISVSGNLDNDTIEIQILTPLTPQEIGTVRCVGLNYTDHAAEMKLVLPTHPEIFMKGENTIHSPTEPVTLPKSAPEQCDPEVELAIVIGKKCKDVTPAQAMEYVLGYMTANDMTARKIQGRGSQWGFSKGFDGFCPLGPCLVSKAAVPDPSVLLLKTTVDGKVTQNGAAKNMIFGVAECISLVSQVSTNFLMCGVSSNLIWKGNDVESWDRHLDRHSCRNRT